jgi:hypothetical protein
MSADFPDRQTDTWFLPVGQSMVERPWQEILLATYAAYEVLKKSPRFRRIPHIRGLLQIGSVFQILLPHC